MATCLAPSKVATKDDDAPTSGEPKLPARIEVGLLTGGGDRHYAFGLAMALISKGIYMDFIGGDEVDSPELHATPHLNYFNLRQNGRRDANLAEKVSRILIYYARLICYASMARPKVFHILWNNKFEFFDRTLLMLYYKLLGKKIALTAHNVNAGARDSTDTLLNRIGLKVQYRLANHTFVHTEKMKRELVEAFGVQETAITVIRYGINNAVPSSGLTPAEARQRLGIRSSEKAMLFFGNIAPYKGLEYLIAAFEQLVAGGGNYRLIVAGRPKKGCETYVDRIQKMLRHEGIRERTILRLELIPDDDTELYFKAADVSVLPYTHIFQSGVLFLGYNFGLPAIAADVGSLSQDIIEGKTGFIFRAQDPVALAEIIEKYFASPLYQRLGRSRQEIRNYFNDRHSWDTVAEITRKVYLELLGN